jgi:DNA-binding beta-propeller fold protein YncE
MVQFLLKAGPRGRTRLGIWLWALMAVANAPCTLAGSKSQPSNTIQVPVLELEGGRKLAFEQSFSSESEVRGKPGFWKKLGNLVAGQGSAHTLVRPYSVVTDSRGRIIVSDPGASGVHIFDLAQHKYRFIERMKERDGLHAPQCLAVDAADNIYVTDSESGKIFVFNPEGKLHRIIGSLKGGEGYFKRPTGIAVDSPANRIYVTDTLRDRIYVLDLQGIVLKTIGQRGEGKVEFYYPTELRLHGDDLIVVDSMNFRIQLLDRSGNFEAEIGRMSDERGGFFRPKGVGIDSEGHLYIVEGLSGLVQVFDHQGNLLYYFGQRGSGPWQFQLPAGIFVDRSDRVYVVDSYNRRIQVFRYFGLKGAERGGQ